MGDFTGELAAIGTSICFSFGSIFFTLAGRATGSSALVNRTRLVLALIFIMALQYLMTGTLLPLQYGIEPWFWLGLSGIVGLVAGDACLFQAFIVIGPRLSMLMMALSPVLGAFLAWVFLGETLQPKELAAIGIVIASIIWVVSEKRENQAQTDTLSLTRREYLIGLLCGLGGAAGQAGGLVLSKMGLAYGLEPVSGNLIRLMAAAIVIWTISFMNGSANGTLSRLKANPRALMWIMIATILGPVAGVSLNLLSVKATSIGVAGTLSSLMPIFLIPISYFAFKERATPRAIIGTVIAIIGTALLFI